VAAALDRAQSDRIGDQPRLEARLDGEQPGDLLEHGDSLTVERFDRGFEPIAP